MHAGLVLAKIVVVLLGLFIAFQGLRAFQRENNVRMLFLAAGFVFVSVGSVLEGVLYDVLQFSVFVAGMVQTVFVAVGMLLILYSLYVTTSGGQRDSSSDVATTE